MSSHRPACAGCPTRPTASVLALCLLVGCQQYEKAPLDLPAHRTSLDQRLLDLEPVEAFMARLRESERAAPDRLAFDDGLSPAEGEVVGLFYNPDLRIRRLEAGVALAAYENAGLWDDPVFGFDGAELLSPTGPFEFGLTLGFTIPISGRLEVEKDLAGAEHEAALRTIVDSEWSTRAHIRSAWARWTAARERVRIIEELIEQLTAIDELADRLQSVGELDRAEARVFSVALANQRAELTDARAQVALKRTALLYLLGLPIGAPIDIEPGFTPIDMPGTDADLEVFLIERNTALAVRRAEYQAAEERLRLEIRKQVPDIEIGGGYGSEDDDRLLLGVSIPIPIINGNRKAIAEARASRELSRALAETTYELLNRDLTNAITEHDVALQRSVELETEVLSRATAQVDELQRLAELGEVNTLLLLEGMSGLFDAKSRLLETHLERHEAAIRIVELIGPARAASPAPVSEPAETMDMEENTPTGDEQ